jgi:transposase
MGMTRLAERVEVVLGVDTHQHQHTAAAVSAVGGVLGELAVPATAAGYARLLTVRSPAPPLRVVTR